MRLLSTQWARAARSWSLLLAAAALGLVSGVSALTISPPVVQNGSISFSFEAASDQTVTVQSAPSPFSGWTNAASYRGTGAAIQFSAPMSQAQQYFRVLAEAAATLALFPDAPALPGGAISLPDATAGEAYAAEISPASGTPPYTVQINGEPPQGVAVSITNNQAANASVLVSATGAGLAAGQRRQFSVTVTDMANASHTRNFDLRVVAPPPQITVSNLTLKAGASANTQLAASGGTGPLTWKLVSGALPAGVTLAATGRLSGGPTADAAERNENGRHTNIIEVADSFTDRVTGAPAPRAATATIATLVRLSYLRNIRETRASGPSLRQTCLSCHGSGFLPDFEAETALALINTPGSEFNPCGDERVYVRPGNLAESLLYQKLSATPPCGDRMPQGGPYFSAQRLERLARWIRELTPQDMD